MFISYCKIFLRANWVHSLKEKRRVVNSIIGKVKSHFNVSICEADSQDFHKSIVIGFSVCGSDSVLTSKITEDIIDFIESNTDAYLEDIVKDIIKV